MKKSIDLGEWWSSLTIAEKERIATKISSKKSGKNVHVAYPQCTKVWNELDDERKAKIYAHLTDDHGVLIPEWQEGEGYSF